MATPADHPGPATTANLSWGRHTDLQDTDRLGRARTGLAIKGLVACFLSGVVVMSGAQVGPPARAAATSSPPGYDSLACGGAAAPTGHAAIVISSDNDWTQANGVTGGSGTPSDPYVISCWSISVVTSGGQGGAAISLGPFALDQAFVLRDLIITGTGPQRGATSSIWFGISLMGPAKLGPANAAVDHTTVVGFDYGIRAGVVDALKVTENQVTNNIQNGIQAWGIPNLIIDGNSGSGNGASCVDAQGTSSVPAQVTNNTCTANHGDGFLLAADTVASANVARGNGVGFLLDSGATALNNVVQGNTNGIVVGNGTAGSSSAVAVTGNTVGGLGLGEANTYDGIDITSAGGSLVSDNLIEGNGTAGIQAAPENTNAGFWGYASTIAHNKIGHSPYGILISAGISTGNVISGTTWTDGQQSIADFGDQNTIVDAGSDKVGAAGQAVAFYDYITRVTLESAPPPPGGFVTTNTPTRMVIETGMSWEFGDGSQKTTVTDPSQGYAPRSAVAPEISHIYAAAGNYTATLTVSGLDQTNQPVTLSDTVPVTIS